jgi:hypothetical protein
VADMADIGRRSAGQNHRSAVAGARLAVLVAVAALAGVACNRGAAATDVGSTTPADGSLVQRLALADLGSVTVVANSKNVSSGLVNGTVWRVTATGLDRPALFNALRERAKGLGCTQSTSIHADGQRPNGTEVALDVSQAFTCDTGSLEINRGDDDDTFDATIVEGNERTR